MPKTKTTLLSVAGVLSLALLTSGAVVVGNWLAANGQPETPAATPTPVAAEPVLGSDGTMPSVSTTTTPTRSSPRIKPSSSARSKAHLSRRVCPAATSG